MNEAPPHLTCSSASAPPGHCGEPPLNRIVIHLALLPGQTVSWRIVADSEIRTHGSRVWLTRLFSPCDYWMQPGDVLRVTRGERIWLSSDGSGTTEVTVTSEHAGHRASTGGWLSRLREIVFDLSFPRAR